jgi:hypothetical protein
MWKDNNTSKKTRNVIRNVFTLYSNTMRNQPLQVVLLTALLALCIIQVLRKTSYKTYSGKQRIAAIAFALVAVLIVFLWMRKPLEGFEDGSSGSSSSGSSSTSGTGGATNQFTIFQTDTALQPLETQLAVYLTSMRPSSYQSTSSTWINIAPRKTVNNTNFIFRTVPTFGKSITLTNNDIRGPSSMYLGISDQSETTSSFVNSPITISYYIRNVNPVEGRSTIFEVYGTPGKAPDNVAYGVYFVKESDKMTLEIQNANDQKIDIVNDKPNNSYRFFDDEQFHLYTIVIGGGKIIVYYDDDATPIYRNDAVTYTGNISLFNPACKLCSSWSGEIKNFTLFKTGLTQEQVGLFYNHLRKEELTQTAEYADLTAKISRLEGQIATTNECPFVDRTVCTTTCPMVTGWANTGAAIRMASSNCMSNIVKYCNDDTKNRGEAVCELWKRSRLDQYASALGLQTTGVDEFKALVLASSMMTSNSNSVKSIELGSLLTSIEPATKATATATTEAAETKPFVPTYTKSTSTWVTPIAPTSEDMDYDDPVASPISKEGSSRSSGGITGFISRLFGLR